MLRTIAILEPLVRSDEQNIWERRTDETAKWFMRFRNYLAMGEKRTINAVFSAEKTNKDEQGRASQRASARWYAAARRYEWEARADAWDAQQEIERAHLMQQVAKQCAFVSRPYRIVQLNSMAESIARRMEQGLEASIYLALCKQLQAVMGDLAEEVASWNTHIDASCDAAALTALEAKQARLAEIQEEREIQEDWELDQLVARAKAKGLL